MKRLFFGIALLLLAAGLQAQVLTSDPAYRVGKLDNGMTYYLYHNELPAGCADFYIAHHVGALQEEDNQNGLAHFLEHMAFNGTRHYPGKGLLEFLAKDGVRFGYNVNAYTSRNETVYNISDVPLIRESFVDSVLLVLHDWSCDISCEQQALDEERGVISEEWRLRDEPRYRMMMSQHDLIYKGSKHTDRTVIGTLEVINGFKREEILDFYHKWYRPDLQAILIVGDFDVDEMEARVKKVFSDIPARVNPEPKQRYFPPKQEEPLFEDITDNRFKFNAVKIICKQTVPDYSRDSEAYIKDWFCRNIVSSAVSDRLEKAARDKSCPARSAVLVTSEYEPDFFVSLFTLTPRNKKLLGESLAFGRREIRRAVLFGISPEEFEAGKLATIQRYRLDRTLNPAEIKNETWVNVALAHFLNHHPLLGPIDYQDVANRILSEITYEDCKPYPARMFAECETIYTNVYNPVEEQGIAPSKEQMQEIIARVDAEELSPQYMEYPTLDLSVDVKAGSIRNIQKKKDYEIWTLSNGVKLYYRPVKPLKGNDHLAIDYHFDTGCRSYAEGTVTSARFASSFSQRYLGFRGCDRSELRKRSEMSGISSLLSTGLTDGSIELSCARNKEEIALKTVYLMMTEPYFGKPALLDKYKEDHLKQLSRTRRPRQLYDRHVLDTVYGHHPWLQKIDSAAVEKVDMAFVEDSYRRMFGDFARMTVFLSSDLDRSRVEELVCRYIASLTIWKAAPKAKTPSPQPVVKGYCLIEQTNAPESEPLSSICYGFYRKVPQTLQNRLTAQVLDYILSARYLDTIREKRGGAYHVAFSTYIPDEKEEPWVGEVKFQTRPEMTELLLQDVKDEMDKMCQNGPTEEELALARKYLIKRHGEVEHRVSLSLKAQHNRLVDGVLYGRVYDYDMEAQMRKIQAKQVRDLARTLQAGTKIVEVYTEK